MFELTLRRDGRCLVVHCASRQQRWCRYIAGKLDAKTRKPKGYRVEFAPGDGREFDAEGRPWHDERAALRQWSLVPFGATPEQRAKAERERLGMVPDLEAARAALEADKQLDEAQVPVQRSNGRIEYVRRPKSLGLPPAPKHAAQVPMFDVPPDPRAVERKRAARAAARAR